MDIPDNSDTVKQIHKYEELFIYLYGVFYFYLTGLWKYSMHTDSLVIKFPTRLPTENHVDVLKIVAFFAMVLRVFQCGLAPFQLG